MREEWRKSRLRLEGREMIEYNMVNGCQKMKWRVNGVEVLRTKVELVGTREGNQHATLPEGLLRLAALALEVK